MKLLISTLTIFLATSASAAGVITGDKIVFQDHSAYVSVVYDDTLCFDGANFHAIVNECVRFDTSGADSGACVQSKKVEAVQPALTTAQRCVQEDEDDACTKWESYTYVQSPTKKVTIHAQNDFNDIVGTKVVTVPSCGSNQMN